MYKPIISLLEKASITLTLWILEKSIQIFSESHKETIETYAQILYLKYDKQMVLLFYKGYT